MNFATQHKIFMNRMYPEDVIENLHWNLVCQVKLI